MTRNRKLSIKKDMFIERIEQNKQAGLSCLFY